MAREKTPKTAHGILKKALETRIRQGWVKGVEGANEFDFKYAGNGGDVDADNGPCSPDTVAWCMIGAVFSVTGDRAQPLAKTHEALNYLADAIYDRPLYLDRVWGVGELENFIEKEGVKPSASMLSWDIIPEFNDEGATTKKEVIGCFQRAIRAAEKVECAPEKNTKKKAKK